MQTERIRFTDYDESIANANLTFTIGVVGVTQQPPSLNETIYMCYLYKDVRYVFGRILVNRVGNLSKWPEDNEFVAYCQSHQDVEFCSPIKFMDLNDFKCCEKSRQTGQSIDDLNVIQCLNTSFNINRLKENIRPDFEIQQHPEKENIAIVSGPEPIKDIRPPLWNTFWKRCVDWLYEVDREPVDPDIRNF